MSAEHYALWSTRQVWLGRLACLPLGLLACAILLLLAAANQILLKPLPDPKPEQHRMRPGIFLPPRPPHRPWPDLRTLAARPIPVPPTLELQTPPDLRPQSPCNWESLASDCRPVLAGEVTPPVRALWVEPRFPEVARNLRLQGQVIMQVVIDRQGSVRAIRLLRGLPFGLSESACVAVRQWRYRPATIAGQPICIYWTVVVSFSL